MARGRSLTGKLLALGFFVVAGTATIAQVLPNLEGSYILPADILRSAIAISGIGMP